MEWLESWMCIWETQDGLTSYSAMEPCREALGQSHGLSLAYVTSVDKMEEKQTIRKSG